MPHRRRRRFTLLTCVGCGLAAVVAVVLWPEAARIAALPVSDRVNAARPKGASELVEQLPAATPSSDPAPAWPTKVTERPAGNLAPVPARTDVPSPGFIPRSDWREVGNATAAAALESYLCAATGGDIERLAQLVATRSVRGFPAFSSRLSEEHRALYGTPEKAAAMMLSSTDGGFATFLGTVTNESGPGGVIVTARFTHEDGRTVGKVFWLRPDPSGYRVDVNGPLLEQFIAGISHRPAFFTIKKKPEFPAKGGN